MHNKNSKKSQTKSAHMKKKSLALTMTPRRKFLVLLLRRVILKDIQIGSNQWINNLFRLLQSQDSSIRRRDVRRWCRKHAWITSLRLPPSGMEKLWDTASDCPTQLGRVSHHYPKLKDSKLEEQKNSMSPSASSKTSAAKSRRQSQSSNKDATPNKEDSSEKPICKMERTISVEEIIEDQECSSSTNDKEPTSNCSGSQDASVNSSMDNSHGLIHNYKYLVQALTAPIKSKDYVDVSSILEPHLAATKNLDGGSTPTHTPKVTTSDKGKLTSRSDGRNWFRDHAGTVTENICTTGAPKKCTTHTSCWSPDSAVQIVKSISATSEDGNEPLYSDVSCATMTNPSHLANFNGNIMRSPSPSVNFDFDTTKPVDRNYYGGQFCGPSDGNLLSQNMRQHEQKKHPSPDSSKPSLTDLSESYPRVNGSDFGSVSEFMDRYKHTNPISSIDSYNSKYRAKGLCSKLSSTTELNRPADSGLYGPISNSYGFASQINVKKYVKVLPITETQPYSSTESGLCSNNIDDETTFNTTCKRTKISSNKGTDWNSTMKNCVSPRSTKETFLTTSQGWNSIICNSKGHCMETLRPNSINQCEKHSENESCGSSPKSNHNSEQDIYVPNFDCRNFVESQKPVTDPEKLIFDLKADFKENTSKVAHNIQGFASSYKYDETTSTDFSSESNTDVEFQNSYFSSDTSLSFDSSVNDAVESSACSFSSSLSEDKPAVTLLVGNLVKKECNGSDTSCKDESLPLLNDYKDLNVTKEDFEISCRWQKLFHRMHKTYDKLPSFSKIPPARSLYVAWKCHQKRMSNLYSLKAKRLRNEYIQSILARCNVNKNDSELQREINQIAFLYEVIMYDPANPGQLDADSLGLYSPQIPLEFSVEPIDEGCGLTPSSSTEFLLNEASEKLGELSTCKQENSDSNDATCETSLPNLTTSTENVCEKEDSLILPEQPCASNLTLELSVDKISDSGNSSSVSFSGNYINSSNISTLLIEDFTQKFQTSDMKFEEVSAFQAFVINWIRRAFTEDPSVRNAFEGSFGLAARGISEADIKGLSDGDLTSALHIVEALFNKYTTSKILNSSDKL